MYFVYRSLPNKPVLADVAVFHRGLILVELSSHPVENYDPPGEKLRKALGKSLPHVKKYMDSLIDTDLI